MPLIPPGHFDIPTDPRILRIVERVPRLFRTGYPKCWSDLPDGWTDVAGRLFADLDAMMSDAEAAKFLVVQVKEKYAGLRVYWELGGRGTTVIDAVSASGLGRFESGPANPTDLFTRIRARVRQAELEASVTCQKCGASGATAGGSNLIITLCEACRAKQ